MCPEFSSEVAQLGELERRRAAASSTNLPLVDEYKASREVRALFAQYREHFARTDLLGIVLCFATNPALLKGMLEIAKNLLFGESRQFRLGFRTPKPGSAWKRRWRIRMCSSANPAWIFHSR